MRTHYLALLCLSTLALASSSPAAEPVPATALMGNASLETDADADG